VPTFARTRVIKAMPEENKRFQLSVLEAKILVTIDNIGWYAYLWFPNIQRVMGLMLLKNRFMRR